MNRSQSTYVVNASGEIIYLDEKLSRQLGYRQEEILGMHCSKILDSGQSPQACRVFTERRTGPRATSGFSIRLRHRDGDIFNYNLQSTGVYDSHRKFMCSQGFLTKTTLPKGEDVETAAAMSLAMEPLVLFELDSGRVKAASRRAVETLRAAGTSLDETLLKDIFPDLDITKLLEKIESLPKGEEVVYTDVSACRVEGQRFPCDVTFKQYQPPKRPAGIKKEKEPESFLAASIRDLSPLKDLEKHLIKANNLQTLGEMACGVAHDFNNLLSAILGHVQLLISKEEDRDLITGDEVRNRLRIVEKAALDGAETVDRILRFSRITEEKDVETLDLNELVRDTVAMTRSRWKDESQAAEIKIEIREQYGSVLPVLGRGSELREVLTNLVFNAVDAISEEGTITIRTGHRDRRVFVSISDTGAGMPADVREKVFQPFFTTKGNRGSGLGLSISCGIIERHEGEIEVKSAPGKGSTFNVLLPASPDSRVRKERKSSRHPEAEPGRILVIDDDKYIREVVSEILVSVGHEVDTAVDGADGLELFAEHEYDLVFTDLGMPGMSGWEVARQIKTAKEDMTVIVMTGWGAQVEEAKIRQTGVDRVIAKPMQMRKVLSVTEEFLRRNRL